MAITAQVVHDGTEQTLQMLVDRYLARYMYTNAAFMGERLFALSPSQKTLFSLATCYTRMGQYSRVYQLLVRNLQEGSGTAPGTPAKALGNTGESEDYLVGNRYLFAKCCYELGKLREAESTLVLGTPLQHLGSSGLDPANPASCQVPYGSAGLYLLGLICIQDNRVEHAVEYLVYALKLDPFLWDAYEQLCKLGATVPPSACFGYHDLGGQSEERGTLPVQPAEYNEEALLRLLHQPLAEAELNTIELAAAEPEGKWDVDEGEPVHVPIPILTPQYIDPLATVCSRGVEYTGATETGSSPVLKMSQFVARKQRVPGAQGDSEYSQTSSKALFVESSPWHTAGSPQKHGQARGGSKNLLVEETKESGLASGGVSSETMRMWGSYEVLKLLYALGRGALLLSKYCCKEALLAFEVLPAAQYNTGWVLHHVGKANFEMAQYQSGRQNFERMHREDPGRTQGLELFSTNLWHLKQEVDLCYLAQRVVGTSKLAPEAWCAIGNCFSLQKEHDVAIKFFERALQLDPNFTYAYTLTGHEYVSNEHFDKAVSCYRHAIRKDSRHYNAWYGLGTIFYRQEKLEMAEYHFRRAIAINPRSSVLYCYLGMVLGASNKYEESLLMLSCATILEPNNPQARYQRATVLRSMERYEEALQELLAVRDFAPRESSVHFLLGRVCKQLHRKDQAMQHFTTALDLDPKDANMIKSAIDKLDITDTDDDDEL